MAKQGVPLKFREVRQNRPTVAETAVSPVIFRPFRPFHVRRVPDSFRHSWQRRSGPKMGTRAIPCVLMRGGTSRGPYFLASDLPADASERDDVLLQVMGSGHELQIDGIRGGPPLTSKVAIVSPSRVPGADVDYLFAQVNVRERFVDTSPNCGNMLAGVGPFALEAGLVPAKDGVSTV